MPDTTPDNFILPEDLQDLSQLTIEPVLTVEAQMDKLLAKMSLLPPMEYEQIIIHGFKRMLSNDELTQHPLVRLLHDFKHLMYHGNRGDRVTREKKEQRKKGRQFENHYCRISMSYLLYQNPHTYDLSVKFAISTAVRPVLTRYDGTVKRALNVKEVTTLVTNFIEQYVLEAEEMIKGSMMNCYLDASIIINDGTKGGGGKF